jgi:hypothetical protein
MRRHGLFIDKGLTKSYILEYMDRLRAKRRLLYRAIPILLTISLCGAQVSLGLSGPGAACVPGAGSLVPFAPVQDHACCCGGADPCCCDVHQGSTATLPDMALTSVSGAAYDLAARYAAFDTGVQFLVPPQALQPTGRETGTGPPLTSPYLANLTIRC